MFVNTLCQLCRVFTNICSLLIEKNDHACQNKVSVCLCVPVLLWPLQFLVRVFTFLSLILFSPINLFCPLDTALISTSDNFHLIFPPPFLSRNYTMYILCFLVIGFLWPRLFNFKTRRLWLKYDLDMKKNDSGISLEDADTSKYIASMYRCLCLFQIPWDTDNLLIPELNSLKC